MPIVRYLSLAFVFALLPVYAYVDDSVVSPAGIAGDEDAVATGDLYKPLEVKCLAYGYPPPSVLWSHSGDGGGGNLVPSNSDQFLTYGNVLVIKNLTLDTMGKYTCQAYNGIGNAVTWEVTVQSLKGVDHRLMSTTTANLFQESVSARIRLEQNKTTLNTGTELQLQCIVDGYPAPKVYWTKDSSRVLPDNRTIVSESAGFNHRLSILSVEIADSGRYTCYVSNFYSTASDSVVIQVQNLVVPENCTDNVHFANCNTIVRAQYCLHTYYKRFCCKSCLVAGQLTLTSLLLDEP